MDKLYMKGELLQVQTKDSTIEGRFFGMNIDKSRLSLYDVKDSPEGNKNDTVCHFYNGEVRNIVKLQDPEAKSKLKLSQKEIEEAIKTSKKYIFINQVDNSFHEALDDLNQYSFIGVSTDGADMARKCKMPFLVLSTPHQIYIFDIHVMQYHAFDAGLKKLLQSGTPKKIVHDCRKISDCLYHKHNVELKSVFDTQVGDLIVSKNKGGGFPSSVKTLPQCLYTYLGLPMPDTEQKLDIVQCTNRPLSSEIKETLAKNITFLHQLSEVIHDEMMLPFVRGVEYYLDHLRSCDDYKAWELSISSKQHELPKDFKIAIEY